VDDLWSCDLREEEARNLRERTAPGGWCAAADPEGGATSPLWLVVAAAGLLSLVVRRRRWRR
jgi:hypothetical protein